MNIYSREDINELVAEFLKWLAKDHNHKYLTQQEAWDDWFRLYNANMLDDKTNVADPETLPSDAELLNWLQAMMTSGDNYCEIFFAGLRNGNSDATEFQIESNPAKFETTSSKTIRETIHKAMQNNKKITEKSFACENASLADVISEYQFKPYGVSGTKWRLSINNESNCQSTIFLHLLNDNETVRVSVSEYGEPNAEIRYIDAIDMFETKDLDKVKKFINLIKS